MLYGEKDLVSGSLNKEISQGPSSGQASESHKLKGTQSPRRFESGLCNFFKKILK